MIQEMRRLERMRLGGARGGGRGCYQGAMIGGGYVALAGLIGCLGVTWLAITDPAPGASHSPILIIGVLIAFAVFAVVFPLAGALGGLTGAIIGWLLPLLPADSPRWAPAALGGAVGLAGAALLFSLMTAPVFTALPLALATRYLPLLIYNGFAAWLAHSLAQEGV